MAQQPSSILARVMNLTIALAEQKTGQHRARSSIRHQKHHLQVRQRLTPPACPRLPRVAPPATAGPVYAP